MQHYTLADDDIEHIRGRRRPENQIGFALQLCAFRYPGRLLKPGEVTPSLIAGTTLLAWSQLAEWPWRAANISEGLLLTFAVGVLRDVHSKHNKAVHGDTR